MYIKDLIIDIGHDLYVHAEQVAAFGSCFLVVNTLNWQGEIIRFTFGVAASILSAYIVHRLKKYWNKKR